MKQLYRIVRTLIVSLLSLAVGIPILLYVLLWLGPVHERLRTEASALLSDLLGAEVSIGSLEVEPFTRLKLGDVAVVVSPADTVLKADRLNAGISGRNLLRGRVVITDVELMGPDIRVNRAEPGAPLNIAPIVERLKGDGSNPPSKFSLAVHTVVIRAGRAAYDVLSAPAGQGLDPNHLRLAELRADLTAPAIGSDSIKVSLKRLNFRERSGLTLRDMAADVRFADNILDINGLKLSLPGGELKFAPVSLDLRPGASRLGEIELLRGSAVAPADFGIAVPPLALNGRVELFRDSLSVRSLQIKAPEAGFLLDVRGEATKNLADASMLTLGVDGGRTADIVNAFTPLPDKTRALLARVGAAEFSGSASWRRPMDLTVAGTLVGDLGEVAVDAVLAGGRLKGRVESPGVDVGALLPDKELGMAGFAADFDLGRADGTASLTDARVEWRGRRFDNISAEVLYAGKQYSGFAAIADTLADLRADAVINLTPGDYSVSLAADVRHLAPAEAGLWTNYPGYALSGSIDAAFAGPELTEPTGRMEINGLTFTDSEGRGLREAPIVLTSDFESATQSVALVSDLIEAEAVGRIDLRTLVAQLKSLPADALPQYFAASTPTDVGENEFSLRATIRDDAPLLSFVKLPVVPLYPITVEGRLSAADRRADVALSAPYLQKGNSLISHTAVKASLGARSTLTARTVMPSKFGDMNLHLAADIADGQAQASVDLSNSGGKAYGGSLAVKARPLAGGADIHVLPSELTFDDVRWTVEPAFIGVRGRSAVVSGLSISRPGQELTVRGVASADAADRLDVKLDNISLDYIFSALQMAPTVQFGGQANGTVSGSALLSSEPILQTEDLHVKDFSYGHCVMGDAAVRARWNHETRGIELHANVEGHVADGATVVDGVIYPLTEELDFRFNARHTPVGFLHTFMSVWASDVGGYASGRCHLFGDFKNVDLEGDFMAENFALTVGFTGVTYYATDSVHIRPGVIELADIELRDPTGHTARLNGRLTHRFFQEPVFEFRITDLDRMLVLDTRPGTTAGGEEERWYGTLRANGTVRLEGVPGHVGIRADVSTAPTGNFAFVLTDAASAAEYNFLTFRDATPVSAAAEAPLPGSPELDKAMRARVAKSAAEAATSTFDIDLQVDVTPDVKMTLVMDPAAGDKITGTGSGHIGLLYGSANDEMRLYGEYVIDRGDYNFSLQDIILKNFTIREGSEVAFHGDPMDARLDISAIYQVNANLSDLDESFLNDKEVQRTNVPVYAVLNVDGSMNDPQISFDLELPTLSSDVKRKVRSIVSTDEMMNRQIIYLLALNRFYTPEYMAATKGNELVSVASGTISSQLSNILGQLSDKISVAPSVRSDAGDFSDVEFDVALSSTLLNNRLLLNGNFGYRDKALNNNQFIGDFDAEYLLTRRGNWRVKAYNHFNDRNLYVKTALTTQGIGLVFKHDFDTLFPFGRKAKPAGDAKK